MLKNYLTMSWKICNSVIRFNEKFNDPIEKWLNLIEDNVCGIDLREADDFDHPIDILKEKNIVILSLGKNFKQSLDNLPPTLKILNMDFAEQFDRPIDNLPQGLEVLKLGPWFNQPIDNLPLSLRVLQTNTYFNQPLNNLPNNLINLRIVGGFFSYSLDKLPESIQVLEIGEKFNHTLENLPSGIKFLTISCSKKTIKNLPINLETLMLKYKNDYYIELDSIPKSLNQIILIESDIVNYFDLMCKYPQIQIVDDYGFVK